MSALALFISSLPVSSIVGMKLSSGHALQVMLRSASLSRVMMSKSGVNEKAISSRENALDRIQQALLV